MILKDANYFITPTFIDSFNGKAAKKIISGKKAVAKNTVFLGTVYNIALNMKKKHSVEL
jgi:hypothetical protein